MVDHMDVRLQLLRVVDADIDADAIDYKALLTLTCNALGYLGDSTLRDLTALIDEALAADKGSSRQCSVRGAGDYRCTLPPDHGGHFHVAQGLNDREIARWPVGEYREP